MQSSDIARPFCLAHGMRAARGFTLIELMVVVAIVAILVAIAYPSYQGAVLKSRRGQAKADLAELAQLAERHHTVNNTYASFDLVPLWTVSPRDGTASYDLELVPDPPTQATFSITATPIAGSAQADDPCGILTINQAGVRNHSSGIETQCQFGTVGP